MTKTMILLEWINSRPVWSLGGFSKNQIKTQTYQTVLYHSSQPIRHSIGLFQHKIFSKLRHQYSLVRYFKLWYTCSCLYLGLARKINRKLLCISKPSKLCDLLEWPLLTWKSYAKMMTPEIRFWAILEWYWLHLDRFELIFGPHVSTNGVIFKWKHCHTSVYSDLTVIIWLKSGILIGYW